MSTYKSTDVLNVFKRSRNINAAVKNFLKKEVKNNPELERFAKNFRSAQTSGDDARALSFIEKYLEVEPRYFLALGGYAHVDFVTKVSEAVVTNHADAFNATYELTETEVEIKNKKEFERIAKAALAQIDGELKTYELADSPFMRSVVTNAIFDDRVLTHVEAL